MLFHITRFSKVTDRNPVAEEASWEHIAHRFRERAIRVEKDGALFSPVRYLESLEGYRVESFIFHKERKDEKIGQVWINDRKEKAVSSMDKVIIRRNDNVRLVSMAVFDFDKGESPQAILEKFKDFNLVLYSTHSSTAAAPKFRLVLPLKEALAPSQFKAAWPFGVEGMDPSCKDLARMFYLPSCPSDHQAEAFTVIVADKKFFAPKIPKEKKEPPKKKRRGDFNTLDAYTWFSVHGAMRGPAGQEHKYWVICPWRANHSPGTDNETEAVLWIEPKKWPTFACSHGHCAKKGIRDVAKLWADADEYCAEELTPDKLKTDTEIRCLGFDDQGRYYYQCNRTNHIVPLKAEQHKELNFYGITSDLIFWEKNYGDPEKLGCIRWKAAAAKMMNECHKRGFFKPEKVRGGGVWEDAGRVVAHLGQTLRVDGVDAPLATFKSTHIYEAMVQEVDLEKPLGAADMRKVYELAYRFPFADRDNSVLLAGMAVCGLLSGILSWRPHLWLTGDQASGKSSILTYFLNPLWEPMGGIIAEGRTTGAGIQQRVGRSAYPVIVDESEADTMRDIDRVQSIVSLARSSSSDTPGRAINGTISGRSVEYCVRSCFALCSITPSLDKGQDMTRFTVLPCRMTDEHVAAWAAFKAELKATLTPEFALGFYARVLELVDVVRENAQVFKQAIIETKGADARAGDQLGHLLGGACALLSDTPVALAKAKDILSKVGHLPMADRAESNVPQAALNILYSFLLQDGMARRSVWEHVEICNAVSVGFETRDNSERILKRFGMVVKDKHLFISSNQPQLAKMFKEAGITGHYGLLSLIEGAESGITVRFGGHVSKAVRIPIPSEKEKA